MFDKLKVIDLSTMLAAPSIAANLADFGANVIKVEHPNGDPLRQVGEQKSGTSFHWRFYNRNKRTMTLSLSIPEGAEIFKTLCVDADVVIENFRPGTLERWGLGWEVLHEINPQLILVRVTGFGQSGPYANRRAFGTVCEAMSGFASLNGDPSGPPLFPPVGFADNVCGVVGTAAVSMALYDRDVNGRGGQLVDLAIYEALLAVQGPGIAIYDQTGKMQKRMGNRSQTNSPRNSYETKDGRWIAISASSIKTATSVMELVGAEAWTREDWFMSGRGRAEHADEIDEAVQAWLREVECDAAVQALEQAQVPFSLIYDLADLMNDPHVIERGSITEIEDDELGKIKVQANPIRISNVPRTHGRAGQPQSKYTESILKEVCGFSDVQIQNLMSKQVI